MSREIVNTEEKRTALEMALTAVCLHLLPDIDQASILRNGTHALDLPGTPSYRYAKSLGITVNQISAAEQPEPFAETQPEQNLIEELKQRLAETQKPGITSLGQLFDPLA